MLYLKNELLADLGLSNIHTTEFWVTLATFIVTFWLRMYVHYLGQYLYLKVSLYTPWFAPLRSLLPFLLTSP